tara:strand:+ start:287 stop:457 length:171 start_codon:yes stop_codon:yes gene_type:complete
VIWSSLHKKWYPETQNKGAYVYSGTIGYEKADTLLGLVWKVARVKWSRYLKVGRRW